MKNKVESIVIVNHKGKGFSATLRFKNSRKDVCLSAPSKQGIYYAVERHVRRALK